jgi:hypothetical protein
VRGDWAWGPPGGARLPDESVEDCATREMLETGVDVPLTRTTFGMDDWVVFVAEVEDDDIVLSDEHDRFRSVGLEDAVASCLPRFTAEPFALVERGESMNPVSPRWVLGTHQACSGMVLGPGETDLALGAQRADHVESRGSVSTDQELSLHPLLEGRSTTALTRMCPRCWP